MELTAALRYEDGSYWAEVKELPGCFASGATLDELREALTEAVAVYVADESDSGETAARSLQVEELKLLVA